MRIRVVGQRVVLSIALLTMIEGGIFFASLYAAALVELSSEVRSQIAQLRAQHLILWPRALLFSVVMVTCLLAFGLYSARQRARFSGLALRFALALAVGCGVMLAIFYFVPELWVGRGVLSLALGGALLGTSVARYAFTHVLDENLLKRRVLVYGAGATAATLDRLRRRADRRGFVLTGFVSAEDERAVIAPERVIRPRAGEPLVEFCQRRGVQEIVVAMDDRRTHFPAQELLQCRMRGIQITDLPSFLERETGRVQLSVLSPGWLIFGEGFRRGRLRRFSARCLDLLASVVVFAMALPPMLLTVLAIKLEEGWDAPVLYRQRRVGLGGRHFDLLKFRSMRLDAESDGKARWAEKGDSRITRVGALIRLLRVDELPQIFNVLKGEMSFVGPRPERPEFVEALSGKIPYYEQRHCVRPGITGWAQLCYPYGRCEQDSLEKLQYDLYYIKNHNFLLDLSILLQTVEVVCLGKGAG